ncbi:AT-hook-containing transcription factor [Otolemur garnettii]|uniref:AT-hook-containing transcription factor n=1 Tax=Otolemur garnettii TaxID=30611 RepID=UPI000C7F2BE8|nr:AT-hook-containing transcription factor [Otolemur garnettii]
MASSGTETHWTRPGLGKGPQRRRWAWAKEEKNADRSGMKDWDEEGPSASASSPELLEDFRLAQRGLLPLEWDPNLQPEGHQDSEAGESSGEIEAEDVGSPESSSLPLHWLPQQDRHLDMAEEEQDGVLESSEVEEAGEDSPKTCSVASLSSESDGNPSPVALGQGQARSWGVSDKQAGGNKPLEHSEVDLFVELCPTRSWSSETMILDHPNNGLDSTWDGETNVPQPTALADTLPQIPSHFLNPDDRTGGSVAWATSMEFQDPSVAPAQSPHHATDRWRKGTPSLSCPRADDQTWKQTKISPKPLPSRFTGSIGPLNPQPRPVQQDRPSPRQGATLAGRSTSDAPKYGQGRLNYPLPDFSKVEPRVRFPKDEIYRPPKSRSHKHPEDPGRPLIFKSPAEIVQEVLLSSGEASLVKEPPPVHPVTRVPQEFQTPEQATKLVHQLQEDYHKLLTKYAEAENTIDQLRLGAKVNLYSDPPRPSHNIHTGTVPQGTKVLSFTIPQPRSVEWWPGPAEDAQASEASGWSLTGRDLSPSSPTIVPIPGQLPENRGNAQDQPSAERTQALASQVSQFLAKRGSQGWQPPEGPSPSCSLVPWLPTNCLIHCVYRDGVSGLSTQASLVWFQGFQQLKDAHAALEEEYLKASREQYLAQQPTSSKGTPGEFDPSRELEAEIYHLGICLEELKDHMNQTQQESEPSRSDPALDSSLATPLSHQPTHLPAPSEQAPTPAFKTLYPKPDAATAGSCSENVKVSSDSSEVEERPQDLPASLRHKELHVEQDFPGLLEQYLSVKSLPEAMRMEEEVEEGEEEEEEEGHTLEVDGLSLAPGKAEATRAPPRQHLAQAKKSRRAPLEEAMEQIVPVEPPGFQTSLARDRHMLGPCKAKAAPPGPEMLPHPLSGKSIASHQSSMTSLEGSGISEHLPQKSLHPPGRPHPEETWMASPETDSGFVGSETSRISPVTQTPEHRISHISSSGTLTQPFTATTPLHGASHPKARRSPVPRKAVEPSTPRTRAQRHLSTAGRPLQQRAPSFRQEQALVAGMTVPGSEFKGQNKISEQVPCRTINPPLTPVPTATPVPRGPAETTPDLLLTRAGRDQAIRELQEEVSRLRLRLEDSLHRPHQRSSAHSASAVDRPTQTRDRPADSLTSWSSHYGSKSTERLSGEPGGEEQTISSGRQRPRSSSVPREVPRLSLSSESEPPSPRLCSEKSRTSQDSPRAAQDGKSGMGSTRRSDRVTFRGQYTGQEYHLPSPNTVPKGNSTVSCPQCQPIRTQDAVGAATRDPLGPAPTAALCCPLCGRAGPTPDSASPATSGSEKAATRKNAPATSSLKRRSKQTGSPPWPPPGLWYLAAAPSSPAPPAFAYISSVPVMPYPSATVYYAAAGPTSAPSASSRPAREHQRSIQLDDLEDLNRALGQAIQAAESVRSATKQMSRSLSANLRQARSPRRSCLF